MEITQVRLTKVNEEGSNQLAYGSITLEGAFVVNGIRVMQADNEKKFISYPSRKDKNGEYKDVCYPMTKELRESIFAKVMEKYEQL